MIALALIACSDRHHPDNFAGGAVHGPALKLQSEDCRECHGDDLTGGTSAISCDGCHAGASPTAWRQNCTFCHGGVENETGAPPRNIHGTDLIGPFPAHPLHVSGGAIANAYDCSQCHDKASDVLSPGHVFDDSPGNAENDYGNGLSPQTTFARDSGTCSNVYCHGSGRLDDGVIAASAGPLPCSGCHPTLASGAAGWGKMSGPHAAHMAATGISCASCHSETTADGTTITSKEQHINGRRDVEIDEPSFTYDETRKLCTGSCHGFSHSGLGWVGGGGYHPPGFGAASVHGPELELQRQDCRGCHGADLRGGTSGILGPSCDTCHTPNWRTTCTFCHGGGIDQTGAPPRDLGSSITNTAQSFVAHPKHVAPKMMTANDCTTCHVKPGDALSMNHAFDSTPMQAEVNLTLDGRNPGATYNGTGTCANLYCHGNGRTNGTYTDGGAAATCTTCHGGKANGKLNLSTLHRDHHLPYECNECHRSVVAIGSTVISNPALHIDRTKQIQFLAPNFTMTNGLCNGACHNKSHTNLPW
jgi:predicted CxxxxCH...CXXCH cytochrome family protein